jgi:multidrug efflux pump subunit AcrB
MSPTDSVVVRCEWQIASRVANGQVGKGEMMLKRLCVILAACALALVGCQKKAAPGEVGPVLVVTTSYPGANAWTVADVVAAPIEQQINGVEGMVRIESESGNDGGYIARVRFKPDADPKLVGKLVQNRVDLAGPILPEEVRRAGLSVKIGSAEKGGRPVAIVLSDREDRGRDALQRLSAAVVKRLTSEGAALQPEVFPGPDEPQVVLRIDREKCATVGVTEADVKAAMRTAAPSASLDELKTVTVTSASGLKIPLGSLAAFQKVIGPAAVYRVNLYPSVRISGFPPEGKTAAEAAARWMELAEAECSGSFGVVSLTAK